MPIREHPSFARPPISSRLWRYTDLPKFLDLLTSRRLWLTNAEVLASEDPYEGLPGPIQFPHRTWRNIEEVPEVLRAQILKKYSRGSDASPEACFRAWLQIEEQVCIMRHFGRREYFVNCWHASEYESLAMWKIYGSPGAGVAVVSNGGRLGEALATNSEDFHLGKVRYENPDILEFGMSNSFDSLLVKRESYSYEKEVRLVYWDAGVFHDALANDAWNELTMRFDDLVEDQRTLTPGYSFQCDVDVLIERLIVSPFAPSWYLPMIERLRDQLGLRFPVTASKLLAPPPKIS